MPELPEVETVRRRLAQAAQGRRIERCLYYRPDYADDPDRFEPVLPLVMGSAIRDVQRRGKFLRLGLGEWWFYLHLGMSGKILLVDPSAPLLPHTHLHLQFTGGLEMRMVDPRRFGGMGLAGADETPLARSWAALGPDALTIRWRQFGRLFERRRPAKNLLLDQSLLAGVGNIYADESLFRAGIHPATPADSISEDRLRRLHRVLLRILREAIEAGGSTLTDHRLPDGTPGWFQIKHRVYGRTGQPCRRCRASIERIRLLGRSTHFCPRCQPVGTGLRDGD